MAAGPATQISDVVVPEIFTPYIRQQTERKSRLIRSGAAVLDPALDAFLAGAGETAKVPSLKPLDDDDDRISTDVPDDEFTGGNANAKPSKIGTSKEITVRLSRNNSWSSMDLTTALMGVDPLKAIGDEISKYWAHRLQKAFIATMRGVFADNDADPDASEHAKGDMSCDVSGDAFSAGVTNFTGGAFIDACATMGDSMDSLGLMTVHSIVYARMQKNNLIKYIPDSDGKVSIPTYQGKVVVVDDGMPKGATPGIFETWIFGAGAIRLGQGTPKVPTEVSRNPNAGNGGGQEVLHSRLEWAIHPVGHAFIGAPEGEGGPSNSATAGNLANADSWKRAYPERKQIKIARLITREF